MADAAWQRLLRYPAELPLVHVDHSHRAVLMSRPAQAPTGTIMGFDGNYRVLLQVEVYRDDGSAAPDILFYDLEDMEGEKLAFEKQKIENQVRESVLLSLQQGYMTNFVLVEHNAEWKTVAEVKNERVNINTKLLYTYLKETAKTPNCRMYLTESNNGPKSMPQL